MTFQRKVDVTLLPDSPTRQITLYGSEESIRRQVGEMGTQGFWLGETFYPPYRIKHILLRPEVKVVKTRTAALRQCTECEGLLPRLSCQVCFGKGYITLWVDDDERGWENFCA